MNKEIASKVFRTISRWPFQLSIPCKESKKFLFGWRVEVIKTIGSFAFLKNGQILSLRFFLKKIV